MPKIAFFMIAAVIFGLVIFDYKNSRQSIETENKLLMKNLTIHNTTIEVEVADTLISRKRGLSGRNNLRDDRGMLFVYGTPGFYPFWMKGMKFPIDIIWIDENKTIIGIIENISPATFPETFPPPSPAQYVLEVVAGWANRNFIQIGDTVNF